MQHYVTCLCSETNVFYVTLTDNFCSSQFLDTDNITWEIEGLGEELTPLSTIFQLYGGETRVPG
jgi:hypothetical protein